jgi:hypothetical protein
MLMIIMMVIMMVDHDPIILMASDQASGRDVEAEAWEPLEAG